ncbi:MAG: hypothetical protein QXT25_02065 [Candidatus Anstonellaceae archaeon]
MVDWVYYSILVGFISLFVAIIMHMVAQAFGLQSLNLWVKGEYVQILVTFLIIAVAWSIALVNTQILVPITTMVAAASGNLHIPQIPPGNVIHPAELGKAYLLNVIECQTNIYRIVYPLNFWFEGWSTLTYDILGLEVVSSGFALTGFVSLFHYIANNIIYLILFNYIQYYLLNFSQHTMLYPFLPIGLVLRSIPVTRGIGGFVTAFALGFAFVFPISYLTIVAVMPSLHGACTQIEDIRLSPAIQSLTEEEPCFTNAASQFEAYYKLSGKINEVGNIVEFLGSVIGIIFLQATFYPLAALIITFTFIRQTSSLLGADLAEIGRGLIKII